MKKVFLEENKTVTIYINDNNQTIIEIIDYIQIDKSGEYIEQLSVDLRYIDYDFYNVIDLYKIDELFI